MSLSFVAWKTFNQNLKYRNGIGTVAAAGFSYQNRQYGNTSSFVLIV